MGKKLLIVLRKELDLDGEEVEILFKKNIMISGSLNEELVESLYFHYFKDHYGSFRISWISGKSIEKNILLLTLMFDKENDSVTNYLINKIEKISNIIKEAQISSEKPDSEQNIDLRYFIINDPKNEFKNFEKNIKAENIKFIEKKPNYPSGTNGATSQWFIFFTEQLLPETLSSILIDITTSGVKKVFNKNSSINHGTHDKDYSSEAIDKISKNYVLSRESLTVIVVEIGEEITSVTVKSRTGRKFKVDFLPDRVPYCYQI